MAVYVLSGPVHSGKTSRLLLWIYHRTDVGGILTPVFYNKRYMLNIPAKTVRLLDADEKESKVIRVGSHRFSQRTLDWGNELLRRAQAAPYRWLVVDEIGPLELRGKGLDATVRELLRTIRADEKHRLLLVVRENLRQQVLNHYGLNEAELRDFNFPEGED